MSSLSMADTAREVGLSPERFRKVWKDWRRELNFPAPFRAPAPGGRGSYAWDPEDIGEWKARRKTVLGEAAPPANDDKPTTPTPSPGISRLARDRAVLRRLMARDS